jgi:glycosyltransferase involved in cell wall biosynthesis
MRVFTALTYYRPHYSGLTIYAERLACALASRGHQVTVLTSQYDSSLPLLEHRDGVRVVRLPVWMHVSKGVIMPGMPLTAWKLARQADVVNLHLPQLDAAMIAILSRLQGKPVVLTYHCDLRLPDGMLNSLANQVSHLANHISAKMANAIVTNTQDYAENSTFLKRYKDKMHYILPPVEVAPASGVELAAFRKKNRIQEEDRIIGMAARLATEKGVEYLVQALPAVLEKYPRARVFFVGQFENVFGEEAYARKLAPMIAGLGDRWSFLGILANGEFAAFLNTCDILVLPSINSTESFGMVQVEAMTCGTPVVATDLPGIRQPVAMTGMGKIIPLADPAALARAILEILDHPERYRGSPSVDLSQFAPVNIAARYEAIFASL